MPPAEPTTPSTGASVPVGVGTIAGLGSGGTAFILAIIGFASGDRSHETIAGLASGAFLVAVTVAGRMLQAAKLATPTVAGLTPLPITQRHSDSGSLLFDQDRPIGGPRHSTAVAAHDVAIEGPEYDTLVSPDDEKRDIHEAV